jgi:heme-degrading monooxygenase HmoA
MLVALTVRRVKPGALDEFRSTWEAAEAPPGWTSAYTVRNLEDENEIVSFGFFDGSLEELRKSQEDFDYAGERAKMDELVESTGTDGLFEVIVEQKAG